MKNINPRWHIAMGALLGLAAAHAAAAALSDDVIRIGFITDMSGVYADGDGPGGAEAIRMAIADAGGAVDGKKIELMVADSLNKPDVSAALARDWFDNKKLDLLIGGTNSAASLAMYGVDDQHKKQIINTRAVAKGITNDNCTPDSIQ
jgi:branched-chain amino acid transport system substrate-binding protein